MCVFPDKSAVGQFLAVGLLVSNLGPGDELLPPTF